MCIKAQVKMYCAYGPTVIATNNGFNGSTGKNGKIVPLVTDEIL